MNTAQRRMARHALGLPNLRGRSYRNRYVLTYKPTTSFNQWDDMVNAGEAERTKPIRGQVRFWLTAVGAKAALDPGETLDPEDFPETPT